MVKPYFINKPKEKEKEKEKEEEVDKENKIEFLSKKRTEPDTAIKEVDMVKLKKKVNEIMISVCQETNKSISDLDKLYESMSKNYLLNEFTSNCLNYINKIIINAPKSYLRKYQGIFELNKIFISIVKELLMNEFELILLSLYLETIDISLSQDVMTFKESLIFICFFIKKLTLSKEKLSPINSFLIRKYQGFEDKFNKWVESNSFAINQKLYFSYAEINKRFKEYNEPCSIYCKNNYLDYNLIIDRILTMSNPYNESKSSQSLGANDINNFFNKNNINQNFLYNNNINDLKNYYPNYISPYQRSVFMAQNNSGYLSNNANILSQINALNSCSINSTINEKEKKNQENKKKGNIKFKLIKEDNSTVNSNKNETKNESSETNPNPKMFFVIQNQSNNNETKNESKETNDLSNNETQNNKNILNKNEEKIMTQNNSINNIKQENLKEQNNIKENNNNQNNIFKQKISNNSINNTLNLYPNNLLGINTSQHFNDYNYLKCNNIPNLGLNDASSQISLLSFKNPLFIDVNNFFNNSFKNEDNYKQLLNSSSEDFFKSCLINSSKNFFPYMGNYIPGNNNNPENENNNNINNNINYPFINSLIMGNSFLQNINITSSNNSNLNNNLNQGKNSNENINNSKNE